MGRCASFHIGVHGDSHTSKPGSGFGMSLTMNIEQYEYIRGPSTDAGIKVRPFEINVTGLLYSSIKKSTNLISTPKHKHDIHYCYHLGKLRQLHEILSS